MGCSSCGGSKRTPTPISHVAMSTPVSAPEVSENMIEITYNGRVGNHYVLSPMKLVRHYGYHQQGDKFYVYPEDAAARPDLFIVEKTAEMPEPEATPEPVVEEQEEEPTPEATPKPENIDIAEEPEEAEEPEGEEVEEESEDAPVAPRRRRRRKS